MSSHIAPGGGAATGSRLDGQQATQQALRPPQGCLYDLYAVIQHHGAAGGGHYTAVAQHPETNTWHLYDDSCVSQVSLACVVHVGAWIAC